jgi:hypothetical protein
MDDFEDGIEESFVQATRKDIQATLEGTGPCI